MKTVDPKTFEHIADLLCRALPFIEDAAHDPAYKPGVAAKFAREIRKAIEPLEE